MNDQGESGGDDEPTEQGFEFFVPPEEEPGAYANTFAIWHTAYDFVLDFGVIQLAQPSDPNDPKSPPVVPARVVSRVMLPSTRVMLPSTLIFEFVKTINHVMDSYERQWGPIKHPEPLEPEDKE